MPKYSLSSFQLVILSNSLGNYFTHLNKSKTNRSSIYKKRKITPGYRQ